MYINVLFFASYKDHIGEKKVQLEVEKIISVDELKNILGKKYPQIDSSINSALISINNEFSFDEDIIPEGAEVAVFPPVSGGQKDIYPTYVAVTHDKIYLEDILSKITTEETGAACIFSGMVREFTNKEKAFSTNYLVYEAYNSMADRKINQVINEIRHQWPAVVGIAVVQRIGQLFPGEPTVMIACSAAHRDSGVFEAARYGIDRLKEIVPIWKKEVGPEGEKWVEGEYRPDINDQG